MKNIDYYIEQSKSMENTSDGGSPAFHFDDVVLVKYSMPNKYGIAREGAEEVARMANLKNQMNVSTPKHIGVKRVTDGDDNYCYVLQERAKGESFARYSQTYGDPKEQIRRQKILVSLPDKIYDKFVLDICKLFHMGLELKPKNMFLDQEAGFTIIDLLFSNGDELNPDSLGDVHSLMSLALCVPGFSAVSSYNDEATEKEVAESQELYMQLKLKIFQSLARVVPDFSQHQRWLLRSMREDELTYFKTHGFDYGDLTLSLEEEKILEERALAIINECLRDVAAGKYEYWQIRANEIRNRSGALLLYQGFMHSKQCELKSEEFEDYYDYDYAAKKLFESMMMDKFNHKLVELSKVTDNPYVTSAVEDYRKTVNNRGSF